MRWFLSLLTCLTLATTLLAQSIPPLTIKHLTGDLYIYITYGAPGNGQPYPSNSLYMVTRDGSSC